METLHVVQTVYDKQTMVKTNNDQTEESLSGVTGSTMATNVTCAADGAISQNKNSIRQV
jgi:hypothetical protein